MLQYLNLPAGHSGHHGLRLSPWQLGFCYSSESLVPCTPTSATVMKVKPLFLSQISFYIFELQSSISGNRFIFLIKVTASRHGNFLRNTLSGAGRIFFFTGFLLASAKFLSQGIRYGPTTFIVNLFNCHLAPVILCSPDISRRRFYSR